jgi:hypothetical protein
LSSEKTTGYRLSFIPTLFSLHYLHEDLFLTIERKDVDRFDIWQLGGETDGTGVIPSLLKRINGSE